MLTNIRMCTKPHIRQTHIRRDIQTRTCNNAYTHCLFRILAPSGALTTHDFSKCVLGSPGEPCMHHVCLKVVLTDFCLVASLPLLSLEVPFHDLPSCFLKVYLAKSSPSFLPNHLQPTPLTTNSNGRSHTSQLCSKTRRDQKDNEFTQEWQSFQSGRNSVESNQSRYGNLQRYAA